MPDMKASYSKESGFQMSGIQIWPIFLLVKSYIDALKDWPHESPADLSAQC